MIQQLTRNTTQYKRPSGMDRLGRVLSAGAGAGIEHLNALQQRQMQEQLLTQENEAAQREGINLQGFRDPKLRHELLQQRSMAQREQKMQELKNEELELQRTDKNKQLLDKLRRNRGMISSLEKEYGKEPGSLADFEENPQLAASAFKPKSENKGGLTGQAVPQEVSLAANKILQNFPDVNADQLKMMMDEVGIPPTYSNGYVENRRRQDERMATSKDKRLEAGQKRAEKVLVKADAIGEELPILESSVMAMEDAITNGDQSFWSSDNLAEMTGIELFRTAKGGQFKTAAKTYFINDLKTSGARPNQFLEKQFVDALAKVGRSQEANQTVLESFKFTNDLKRKRLETIRELEKYYDESLGYLPSGFSRIVEETMEPYIKDRQKEYESRLKDIHVQEKKKSMKNEKKPKLSGKMIDVIGPDGQTYEVDQSEVEMLPEGYRLQ